jgi:endoglucanase
MKKTCSIIICLAVTAALMTSCGNEAKESNAVSGGTEASETITMPKGGSAVIPSLNIKKYDIPQNDSLDFVKKMKIGWNLGNTFDANSDTNDISNELDYESKWCGIKTTKQMIDTIKAAGFNTIRIPVSWHNHVSGDNFTISKEWLDRIQEVVDYAVDNDMYVILNIHHDIYEQYYYPTNKCFETSTKYMTAIWTQLCERFGDYDDHMIFESINEPRFKGTKYDWWLDMSKPECQEAVECINKLNQVFVDTVRATGGNNKTRYLMVPGYCAAADYVILDEFRLPQDIAENKNKVIVSVHAYTPYNFALQSSAENGSVSDWEPDNQKSTGDIDRLMDNLYGMYVMNGTPVVIGEFGARDKNGNLQDRVNYASYYIAAARARGITCLWWDNNAFTGTGENFGLLMRQTSTWTYPDIVLGMMKYAE